MPKIIENLSHRLLAEARRQALDGGYSALTIRQVAKNCGVGVGTVYNYFPSKDALIAGFLLEDWRLCLERIRQAASGTFDAAVAAVHGELLGFHQRYAALFRSATSITDPPKHYHRILRAQLSALLAPQCPDGFSAEFLAEALLTWTVEGIALEQLLPLLRKLTV